jgi:hypothetical protein
MAHIARLLNLVVHVVDPNLYKEYSILASKESVSFSVCHELIHD